jgi:hypothetical protein
MLNIEYNNHSLDIINIQQIETIQQLEDETLLNNQSLNMTDIQQLEDETLPKKRGRKPKNHSLDIINIQQIETIQQLEDETLLNNQSLNMTDIQQLEDETLPKKRGRKPKNHSLDIINIQQIETIQQLEDETLLNNQSLNMTDIQQLEDEILPKKRGRKPKNHSLDIINIQQIETIQQLEDEILPKKRGRKPKNHSLDMINIQHIKNKTLPKKEKSKINKDQKIDGKINVDILGELDLSTENNETTPDIITDMVSNIWLNKYQPKTLNEVIGNKEQILKIKNWLNNYDNSIYHAVIISGGHGIGKNLIVKLALQESDYQIKNIYSTSLKNKNIVSEIIHSCAKTKNAYTSFNQTTNQKYAIVIDDTESITLTSEKNNLLELFKFNSENKYFPLIFISNLQHSKLINNLKKLSLEITLYSPSIDQIKAYMIIICKKEQININDDKIYNHIIKFCQSDIRRLLFVLQDLFCTYSKKIITYEMFKEYQHMSQKKDIDVGLYYAAKNLLDNYNNINDCLQLYETEKVLLPLTIYENFYRKIFKQNLIPSQILKIMSNVTNSISIGDVIETNIYSDQNWFLQNIHGFYTCVDTSYIMNTVQITNDKKKDIASKQKINYDVIFSADLNKTSSKNINKKKNIIPLQAKFKDKNIEDILYINKIFLKLGEKNMISTIASLKDTYKLDNKFIQIALKIDKTNFF